MKNTAIAVCLLLLFSSSVFSLSEIDKEIEILKIETPSRKRDMSIHKKKWQAKKRLVEIGSNAVEPLINSLDNNDAKYYIIRALGEIGDERAIEPLSKILLNKKDTSRRYAAMALGRIRSKKAVPILQQVMAEEDGAVKKDARIALERIENIKGP